MINLYQLQIFVAVGELGTFSAAAEAFSLTQPGVSQHIRTLEETYKVKLFNRNGPRIELTEAGQRLLETARPLLEQAARLEENFSANLGEVRGKLSLSYSKNTISGLYLLLHLLADFHQRYSSVSFSIFQLNEEEATSRLLDRDTHFSLLSARPRHKSLESMLVHTDEIGLALPPGHPWSNNRVSLGELKGQSLLVRAAGSETRRLVETALRSAGLGFNDLHVVAELDSAEGIVLAAQAGLGLGFVGQAIAARFAEKGIIGWAQVEVSEREKAAGIELRREIYLARLASLPAGQRGPSQERLWEYLRAHPGVNSTGATPARLTAS